MCSHTTGCPAKGNDITDIFRVIVPDFQEQQDIIVILSWIQANLNLLLHMNYFWCNLIILELNIFWPGESVHAKGAIY